MDTKAGEHGLKYNDAGAGKDTDVDTEKTERQAGTETGRHIHTHTERKRRQLFEETNWGINAEGNINIQ